MVKVTVDWIELKYALVRFTVRCIGLVMAVAVLAGSVAVSLLRSFIKGNGNE